MARVGPSGNVYLAAYALLYLFSMSLAVSTVSYNSFWYWDSDGNLVFYNHTKTGAWRVYFEPWPLLIGSILIMVARGTIRNRFKIPGNCCTDCICYCFCSCCVLAQMSSHVEAYTPGQCNFGSKDTLPSYHI
ncbi:unnamed protein product [Aphanomyces euteiches]|nr:hypothetical protein AeRB84_010245 [Aphanomyces euteiches]